MIIMETIICSVIVDIAVAVITIVLVAKTKAGWSYVNEQEDETDV